jgi:DUF4097 and DUF4098 domain-containing protein YvlB
MKRSTAIRISFAILFVGALLSIGCDEISLGSVRDEVHKTFRVESGGKLVVDSDLGSIDVSSGGMDQVRIDIEREVRGATNEEVEQVLQELRLDFRPEGNDVFVQARYPGSHSGFNRGGRLRLRFVILVPNKYNLELKTGGGSISVKDLQGTVQARTSGGSLQFGRINGSVNGRTSGGSISLEGGSGPVEVETSGGSIRIGKANGPVKAHTSGGGISVEEVQGMIEASTSGGSVEAMISRQPEGDCELSTSGGSIRARLSRDLNLNLFAKTSGGSVRTDIPVTVQGEISRSRLEAKMNQGGPSLRLHTSGGSISITGLK